jgi:hypothetical protein
VVRLEFNDTESESATKGGDEEATVNPCHPESIRLLIIALDVSLPN